MTEQAMNVLIRIFRVGLFAAQRVVIRFQHVHYHPRQLHVHHFQRARVGQGIGKLDQLIRILFRNVGVFLEQSVYARVQHLTVFPDQRLYPHEVIVELLIKMRRVLIQSLRRHRQTAYLQTARHVFLKIFLHSRITTPLLSLINTL